MIGHEAIVPLKVAMLCMDCNNITASRGPCVACGSRAIASVQALLGHVESSATLQETGKRRAKRRQQP